MSNIKQNLSPSLAALYSAAFTLPIYNKAVEAAGAPDSAPSVSARISKYDEDNLSSGDFSGLGDQKRYDIEVGQVSIVYPINDTVQLTVDSAYEKMSGASPWFVQPDAQNNPVQVMSSATIDDARFDASAKLDIYKGKYTISPSVGFSTEKDYQAVFGGVSVARELDNKSTTLRAGLAASFDEVKPTDDPSIDPGRPDKEDKENVTGFVGIGQVINKNTVVQSTFTVSHYSGYLSDPYKLVFNSAQPGLRDNRPDDRTQYIWSAQLRRWSEIFNAALHADYRFYMTIEGKRYAHILNPKTGWPIEGLSAVSEIASECLIAGSCSTVAMLKGEEEGKSWLEDLKLPYICIDNKMHIEGTTNIN